MKPITALSAAALIAAAMFSTPLVASAEDSPAASTPTNVELPTVVIRGTPQRPAAQYILSRSGTSYRVEDLRQSFVPRVIESVRGEAFE